MGYSIILRNTHLFMVQHVCLKDWGLDIKKLRTQIEFVDYYNEASIHSGPCV